MMRRGRRSPPSRRTKGKTFQQLADEAFADLLKKHKQPVGLKAALKESVGAIALRRGGNRLIAPVDLCLAQDHRLSLHHGVNVLKFTR